MTPSWFERFLEQFCSHRFSWPHTGPNGQDYQVCLDCGVVYEFDCATMQRTRRIAASTAQYQPESGKPLGSQG
ncbi:MAG TPA: hypothetical protein VLW84_01090 [Terriglobales bacterium]|nr:hypothetical protein [Terriglobales bacterium]